VSWLNLISLINPTNIQYNMSDLYNPERSVKAPIISEVQGILNFLHDTGKSIASTHALESIQDDMQLSRTGANLYLTLHQAIILAIRPMFFHLLKWKIRWSRGDAPPPTKCPEDIRRLTSICRDSATKIVRILKALRVRDMISPYLCFDLDAVFSAAVVFFIDGIVSLETTSIPSPGAVECCQILQSMAEVGNEAAARRGKDIENLYTSIYSSLRPLCPHRFNPRSLEVLMKNPGNEKSMGMAVNGADFQGGHTAALAGQSCPQGTPGSNTESSLGPDVTSFFFDNQGSGQSESTTDEFFPLSLDPQLLALPDADFRDMYYDPDLSLTGIDSSDWMELERLFQDFQGAP